MNVIIVLPVLAIAINEVHVLLLYIRTRGLWSHSSEDKDWGRRGNVTVKTVCS